MQHFTSSLSGQKFPVSERVPGKTIRNGILKEIQKDHPSFTDDDSISLSELNNYRQLYVQRLLSREVGTLTELERTVLDNINQNHLIADEASEVKNPVTRGQLWADRIATFGGSWRFIGIFGFFLFAWMLFNAYSLHNRGFDPYPFILLNLILSCLAAIQAPVIMMSQNRQEEKDRVRARNDYMINLKSEMEIRIIHEKLDHLLINQQQDMMELQQIQINMMNDILEALKK